MAGVPLMSSSSLGIRHNNTIQFKASMIKTEEGGEALTFTVAPTHPSKVPPSPRNEADYKLNMTSGVIRISDLPSTVAAALAGLDLDGDGTIDVQELSAFHERGERAVRKHQKYRKLFFMLFFLFVCQLIATFGVVIGVVIFTRQTLVSSNVMVVKGTKTPVQVASTDTFVGADGRLQQRGYPGAGPVNQVGRRLLQATQAFPYAAATSPTTLDFEPLYTSSDTGLPLPRLLAAEAPTCDWASPDFKQQTGACSTAHKLSNARQTVVTFPVLHGVEGEIAQPFYATSVAYFKESRSLACQGGQMYVYTFSATSSITICMHASLTADYTSDAPDFGTTAFFDYINFEPPAGFSKPCSLVTGARTTSGALMPDMCLYPSGFVSNAINASNVYDPNSAASVFRRRKLMSVDDVRAPMRHLLAPKPPPSPPSSILYPPPPPAPPAYPSNCYAENGGTCCNEGCCCLPSCTACASKS